LNKKLIDHRTLAKLSLFHQCCLVALPSPFKSVGSALKKYQLTLSARFLYNQSVIIRANSVLFHTFLTLLQLTMKVTLSLAFGLICMTVSAQAREPLVVNDSLSSRDMKDNVDSNEPSPPKTVDQPTVHSRPNWPMNFTHQHHHHPHRVLSTAKWTGNGRVYKMASGSAEDANQSGTSLYSHRIKRIESDSNATLAPEHNSIQIEIFRVTMFNESITKRIDLIQKYYCDKSNGESRLAQFEECQPNVPVTFFCGQLLKSN
jgi:hypothetical protein